MIERQAVRARINEPAWNVPSSWDASAIEWGRVVSDGLIRRTGDWDLAEDCASEASRRSAARLAAQTACRSGRAPG